jgi:DNA topoisomerase IA
MLLRVSQGGHIVNVEAKPRKEPPPLLHDLSSLQQEANKRKGFTADQTLNHTAKPVRGQTGNLPAYRQPLYWR